MTLNTTIPVIPVAGFVYGILCAASAFAGYMVYHQNTPAYQISNMLVGCISAGQDGIAMLTQKTGMQITCSLPQELPARKK